MLFLASWRLAWLGIVWENFVDDFMSMRFSMKIQSFSAPRHWKSEKFDLTYTNIAGSRTVIMIIDTNYVRYPLIVPRAANGLGFMARRNGEPCFPSNKCNRHMMRVNDLPRTNNYCESRNVRWGTKHKPYIICDTLSFVEKIICISQNHINSSRSTRKVNFMQRN